MISDLGGISEAVTHGVNGWLFPAGDTAALANVLRALSTEPGLVGRLRRGIPAVKTVQAEVDVLTGLYQAAMRVGQQSRPDAPVP